MPLHAIACHPCHVVCVCREEFKKTILDKRNKRSSQMILTKVEGAMHEQFTKVSLWVRAHRSPQLRPGACINASPTEHESTLLFASQKRATRMAMQEWRQTIENMLRDMDRDNSGKIEYEELASTLKRFGMRRSKAQIRIAIKDMDKDNDGAISHTEFRKKVNQVISTGSCEAADFMGRMLLQLYTVEWQKTVRRGSFRSLLLGSHR